MKILILANADSGLYRFRREVLEEFMARGWQVTIALPEGPFVQRLIALGCRYIPTPFERRGMNPIAELGLMRRYLRILKDVKPDVVLTYTVKPNVYGGIACRLRRVPCIANVTGLGASIEKGGLLRFVMLILYRTGLKKDACVFFQNEANRTFMTSRAVARQSACRMIPGSGVNTTQFAPLKYPADDTLNFLFIARIMKEKGIEEYLAAAEHFNAAGLNAVFHILGNCEESYQQRIDELSARGIVVFHGEQSDVRAFHELSHCTIHPSYWEGMSNVVLESAACARPVITSDISGCREAVDDGVTGFLIERGSADALIDAIHRFTALTNEARRDMGLAGRAKIERAFDRQIVINAYVDAIERTCPEQRA